MSNPASPIPPPPTSPPPMSPEPSPASPIPPPPPLESPSSPTALSPSPVPPPPPLVAPLPATPPPPQPPPKSNTPTVQPNPLDGVPVVRTPIPRSATPVQMAPLPPSEQNRFDLELNAYNQRQAATHGLAAATYNPFGSNNNSFRGPTPPNQGAGTKTPSMMNSSFSGLAPAGQPQTSLLSLSNGQGQGHQSAQPPPSNNNKLIIDGVEIQIPEGFRSNFVDMSKLGNQSLVRISNLVKASNDRRKKSDTTGRGGESGMEKKFLQDIIAFEGNEQVERQILEQQRTDHWQGIKNKWAVEFHVVESVLNASKKAEQLHKYDLKKEKKMRRLEAE
eukprot:PhF_6_TR11031/c0_g1_i1/m.17882